MSYRASGLRAWALQRVTAVYLGLFSILLAWHFLAAPPADFAAWRDWVVQPWVSIGLLIYVVALLLHAWVGIRDVFIDYVHPLGIRLVLLTLFGLLLLGSGMWAVQAVVLARLAA
jgi:succinate dehydrogenase / fumarate reductase membrane anchor subunit